MGVGRSYCSNYGPWPLDFKIGLLLNSAQRKSCRERIDVRTKEEDGARSANAATIRGCQTAN